MSKWSVKLSGYVRHNHQSYGPGDTLPGLTDGQVEHLEKAGVVVSKELEAGGPGLPEAPARKPVGNMNKAELLAYGAELGLTLDPSETNKKLAQRIKTELEARAAASADAPGADGHQPNRGE
ncbi:MAG: hypothetical protein QME79_12530 [Bacillota bacterium]|nr:hypothetical protein [Bacillota bacterium]